MANKITNKEMYLKVMNELESQDLKDFIQTRIDILDKKAENAKNATRKPTATQKANESIKADILAFMTSDRTAKTIADIKTKFDLSSQKVTPLMNALVVDNKLSKVVDKKVAYYSVV